MRSVLLIALVMTTGVALAEPPAAPLAPRPQSVVVAHRPATRLPVLGPRHAPVTADFFMNLGNSQSQQLHSHLGALRRRHPRRLRVIYRLVTTERYRKLTEAVMEAFAQDRFEPFLAEVLAVSRPPRTPEDIEAACARAGVRFAEVQTAWADGRHARILERNDTERQRRAGSLPGILFNGVDAGRASRLTRDRLEGLYREALGLARARLARGVPLAQVYQASLRELALAAAPLRIEPSAVDGVSAAERLLPATSASLLDQGHAVPGHGIGPDHAPVAVHLYCNFLSSNCALVKRSIDSLRREFPVDIRLVFHHLFPDLEEVADAAGRRQNLVVMHQASLCAAEQDAFWDFYEVTYRDYLTRRHRHFDVREQVREIARDLAGTIGLDQDRYQACMARDGGAEAVLERVRAARRAGVAYTPSVVIGGRIYPGIRTPLELRKLVEQELLPGLLEQLVPTWDSRDRAFEHLAP